MAEKKVTRTVAHPKLYLSVAGKLQHIKKGTEVTVTESQCEAMGAKLMDPSQAEKLDTTTKDGVPGGGAAESEVVAALTAELEAAKAETAKTTEALTATAAELDKAQKALKAVKK